MVELTKCYQKDLETLPLAFGNGLPALPGT